MERKRDGVKAGDDLLIARPSAIRAMKQAADNIQAESSIGHRRLTVVLLAVSCRCDAHRPMNADTRRNHRQLISPHPVAPT
jgi:hypothetical protein